MPIGAGKIIPPRGAYPIPWNLQACYVTWQRGIQVTDAITVANQLISDERTPPPIAGFNDGGRSHDPRDAGEL